MSSKRVTFFLFCTYMILLTWVIVFKMDLSHGLQARYAYRSINLIPLEGTAVYDGRLDYLEIGVNVLLFVPFGIYLEALFREHSWLSNLFWIACVSLGFEVVQYLFILGVADVTDLLANSFGGACGIILMYLLTSIWQERSYRLLNSMGLLVTVVSLPWFFLSL